MLKMYQTQLRGVFETIAKKNEEELEDAGRLLAQAVTSDGTLFIHGFDEMNAVAIEALEGLNRLPTIRPLLTDGKIETTEIMDRVLLFARDADHQGAVTLAESIAATGAMTVGLSSTTKEGSRPFADTVDLHIDLGVNRPLVPLNDERKIGLPSTMAALFTYNALYFSVFDILDDQNFYEFGKKV